MHDIRIYLVQHNHIRACIFYKLLEKLNIHFNIFLHENKKFQVASPNRDLFIYLFIYLFKVRCMAKTIWTTKQREYEKEKHL